MVQAGSLSIEVMRLEHTDITASSILRLPDAKLRYCQCNNLKLTEV